jgi:hypothetical protein
MDRKFCTVFTMHLTARQARHRGFPDNKLATVLCIGNYLVEESEWVENGGLGGSQGMTVYIVAVKECLLNGNNRSTRAY